MWAHDNKLLELTALTFVLQFLCLSRWAVRFWFVRICYLGFTCGRNLEKDRRRERENEDGSLHAFSIAVGDNTIIN